jgi:mevalonate kinase
MKTRFYSNGKLLITSEYGVLDGALALAVPTKYGQSLEITPLASKSLEWQSLDEKGEIWFAASFDPESFEIQSCSHQEVAKVLSNLLGTAKGQNPSFRGQAFNVTLRLTFPRNWGLGSSSTLINNLAQWANVSPYVLLRDSFGGSGYDIACAQHDSPILYQLKDDNPLVQEVSFDPAFKHQLYFVFLNQKQNSREAIANYRKQDFDANTLVGDLSNLTQFFLESERIDEFETHIKNHEKLLSKILKIQPVKERLFPDYYGAIKSLGGWGGDFIMVTGNEKTPDYFKAKGYDVVIPYDTMVL